MEHKKAGIFKRTAISVMAAVCALTSATALSANAASTSERDTLSNGYVVTTTATRTTYTASGKAAVTSGGPTTIHLVTKGFFGSTTKSYNSSKKKDKDSAQSATVDPFDYYLNSVRLITYKVKSTATYGGETAEAAVVK